MLILAGTPAVVRRKPSSATILGVVLLCSTMLSSCGGTLSDTSNTDEAGAVVEICDGSARVRLAALTGGGGLVHPGVYVLSENGWHYLLVSGQCEAWVLKEPTASLRHVVLSREQARLLARGFRLGEWSSITPAFGGCSDAPNVRFHFDKDEIIAGPCGLKPEHPVSVMDAAFRMQTETLYAAGSAAEWDVRYWLAVEPTPPQSSDAYYRNAPPWPLSSSPDAVAISFAELSRYQRGVSRHASAEEASTLRALRTSWLERAIGWRGSGFIPIVGADGARFQLYVRDSSPWETASGLHPDDLTWP
jgi:hypothetical protein